MRINNYRGTVVDRPIDSVVIDPNHDIQNSPQPQGPESFIERILNTLNNQRSVVPVGDLPVYNKG